MLEVRWAAYCKVNGMHLPGEISPGMFPLPKNILYAFADLVAKKGKGKAKPSTKGGRTPDADGILPSSDSGEDAEEPVGKKRKPAVKKPPKQYIPQRGSGGYGIVLALVLAIDRPETTTTVYLTKSEIIRAAKEYCDSSYEHSEKGTYFTAWSGMKTMVNKGLVYMTGNPHKFCLTEEG
jgi:crossover junction endonuclease MUS81